MVKKKQTLSVIIGEEVTDPDLKAIHLISEAMRISTPRMRVENLEFVLKRYNLKVQRDK